MQSKKIVPKQENDILCACGKPLHYSGEAEHDLAVAVVRAKGEFARVTNFHGTRAWMVPRHFYFLHEREITEESMAKFGFEETK